MWKCKICESLNKFWKFYLNFWKVLRKCLYKFGKINENYNFSLLSILIAGWVLGCSPSFANFPGFRGGGEASPFPPGYATGIDNMLTLLYQNTSSSLRWSNLIYLACLFVFDFQLQIQMSFNKQIVQYLFFILVHSTNT